MTAIKQFPYSYTFRISHLMIEQESDVPAVWDGFGGGEVQCQ